MAPDAAAYCYLPLPPRSADALATLAEPVGLWFRQAFGIPTAAQRFAWPALQRGDHLLLCAPTGTGKTLAAFLPIISRLWDDPVDGLTCLYIAPMKALGRDVAKNVRRCLRDMQQSFRATMGCDGQTHQPNKKRLRVGLRTGDTTAAVRRRQLERPPHILLTTPESLAVLLTNPRACEVLRNLRWIVVDEIHAMAGNKRGADLALSLERLEALKPSAEYALPMSPQRIGLSATCFPIQTVAQFLVGAGRSCTIAQVPEQASFELVIEPLSANDSLDLPIQATSGFMARLVARLEAEIATNRTTLIFTNIRSTAERLTWALKRRFPDKKNAIAVHHSSLAAPRRRNVERGLKKGRLEIVVTSTSLELGIDIGSVDGVVFVHPPGGVARFLQRIGRSGHRPERLRRGLMLTSGAAELLEATVTAAAARIGQLESLTPPLHPLDVLCQHLACLAMTGSWTADEAYRLVCRAYPYRDLARGDFDDCLAYLSGKHADGHTWLPSRLQWRQDHFAIINPGTLRLLRRNLGTILNEETRAVRLLLPEETDAEAASPPLRRSVVIGTVDDAYADRLRPGDRLLLDGRCFEYRRREKGALLVDEMSTRPVVPRWLGSGWSLSRELAQRLFLFRQQAADALREGPRYLRAWLATEYSLGEAACAELARLFLHQEAVSEIPDAGALLVETVADDLGVSYYLHTPLHRAGNDALARVAARRLFQERGLVGQTIAADLGFALTLPTAHTLDAQDWRALLTDKHFDDDLGEALADCPSLRERFAQVATIGLMVLRNPLGGRRKVGGHDWAQRRLFDQIRDIAPEFVLLRQAEREMKSDLCDSAAARRYLRELPERHLRCRRLGEVSPFAANWTQPGEVARTSPDEVLADLHAELVGFGMRN